jgi:hypothetical protein
MILDMTDMECQEIKTVCAITTKMVTALHFIMVQVLTLILAAAGKPTKAMSVDNALDVLVYGFGMISYIGIAYALFLALATAVVLYRLLWLHDKHLANARKQKDNSNDSLS